MGTINLSLPSDGESIDAADVNSPLNTIATEINGNLDNANIASNAAIAGSKLATDGVGATQLATGVPVQMASVSYNAVATGTTIIPIDDTIPQNTEGTEFMTLAITPKSTTNILVIEAVFYGAVSAGNDIVVALFQDSTAGALAAQAHYNTNNARSSLKFTHRMVAGTTSATTFKIRAGGDETSTITFNGGAGSRHFGDIPKSSLVITEYKAS